MQFPFHVAEFKCTSIVWCVAPVIFVMPAFLLLPSPSSRLCSPLTSSTGSPQCVCIVIAEDKIGFRVPPVKKQHFFLLDSPWITVSGFLYFYHGKKHGLCMLDVGHIGIHQSSSVIHAHVLRIWNEKPFPNSMYHNIN